MMQPARERPGTAAQKGIGHRMQTALMGWVHQLGTLEYWEALLAGFEGLGPLVPILLAMVGSLRPDSQSLTEGWETPTCSASHC